MKVILSEEQIKRISAKMALNEDEVPVNADDMVQKARNTIRTASRNINNILSTTSGGYDNDDAQDYKGSNTDVNRGWINSVKNTFNRYKGQFGNQYSQNATIGHDRADCSGFVFSALRDAGYNVGVGNTDTMINSPAFTNAISGGFKRIPWRGPADSSKLPPGTILAYGAGENGKRYGHTLILGPNGTSYDYGKNAHTEYSPNLRQIYTAAWVPIA